MLKKTIQKKGVIPGILISALGLASWQAQAEPIVDVYNTFMYNDTYGANRFFFTNFTNQPLVAMGGFVTPSPDSQAAGDDAVGNNTRVALNHPGLAGLLEDNPDALTPFGIPSGFPYIPVRYNGPTHDPVNNVFGGAGPADSYYTVLPGLILSPGDTILPTEYHSGWELGAFNPDLEAPDNADWMALPDLDPAAVPGQIRSMTISGDPTAPTVEWDMPDTGEHNAASLAIWRTDIPAVDEGGLPRLVHAEGIPLSAFEAGEKPSFEIPSSFVVGGINTEDLDPEGTYLIGVNLDYFDPTAELSPTSSSDELSNALRGRTRTFFEFSPDAALGEGEAAVYLPKAVGVPATDAEGNLLFDENGDVVITSEFHFDIDVVADEVIFIDPFVAVGYDYEIGIGDPNFASVLLPEIGDDLFELYLFDDLLDEYVFESILTAGITHAFDPGGVSRFRILGIETAAELDPDDPTAFITGLAFTGPGTFTGTMTPIVTEVPEPAALLLLMTGLLGIRLSRQTIR